MRIELSSTEQEKMILALTEIIAKTPLTKEERAVRRGAKTAIRTLNDVDRPDRRFTEGSIFAMLHVAEQGGFSEPLVDALRKENDRYERHRAHVRYLSEDE